MPCLLVTNIVVMIGFHSPSVTLGNVCGSPFTPLDVYLKCFIFTLISPLILEVTSSIIII